MHKKHSTLKNDLTLLYLALWFIPLIIMHGVSLAKPEGDKTHDQALVLNTSQLREIGQKIYRNETGANPQHLIAWNNGESFASLGLGHFIWFPKGLQSPFTETFPSLLAFMKSEGVKMPLWLERQQHFPWQTKQKYIDAKDSKQMAELRELLSKSFEHQVNFIYQRMQASLPLMLRELDDETEKQSIRDVFYTLAQSELGMYALIDYVNFKGEGVSLKERYKNQGWGLLQVLQHIPRNSMNVNADFSQACDKVLSRRVENSPQQDIETKWLTGWRKRCQTYSQ